MVKMEPNFSGWVTKANTLCADGVTISPGAFAGQSNTKVPLVWQHGHDDVENVLGHVLLTDKPEGVWGDVFLNSTNKAQHALTAVRNRDITAFSIWANKLEKIGNLVKHGIIREVSLALAGQNPGAAIDFITIRHSDFDEQLLDEAIIHGGVIASKKDKEDEVDEDNTDGEMTIAEVLSGLSDTELAVVDFLVGQAAARSAINDDNEEDSSNMAHYNPFENNSDANEESSVLTHDALTDILAAARRGGSLAHAINDYVEEHIAHGVVSKDLLFPDYKDITNKPGWIKRDSGWASELFNAVTHQPFAKIRTRHADLTYEQARARGYVTGNLKRDQYLSIIRRTTEPTTVYAKQAIDRDDLLDITDFDMLAWLKEAMGVMLMEEIGRAILFGDGRDIEDPDRIDPEKIRPVAMEDDLFAVPINVPYNQETMSVAGVIDAVITSAEFYKGTGTPNFYTSKRFLSKARLMRDNVGRRMYESNEALARELGVAKIITIDLMQAYPDVIGIVLNPVDYVVGANAGGQVTSFEAFDLDYNRHRVLKETRCSGALTVPSSAVVIRKAGTDSVAATPDTPTQDSESYAITIPDVLGVKYFIDGAQVTGIRPLDPGEAIRVSAMADDGYHLTVDKTTWSFLRPQE